MMSNHGHPAHPTTQHQPQSPEVEEFVRSYLKAKSRSKMRWIKARPKSEDPGIRLLEGDQGMKEVAWKRKALAFSPPHALLLRLCPLHTSHCELVPTLPGEKKMTNSFLFPFLRGPLLFNTTVLPICWLPFVTRLHQHPGPRERKVELAEASVESQRIEC